MTIIDKLERFQARRILFSLAAIPLTIIMIIVMIYGYLMNIPELLLSSIIALYVLACFRNYYRIRSLNTDQLASARYYRSPLFLILGLTIFNIIITLVLYLQMEFFSLDQSIFFILLSTSAGGYFGFSLPLSIHRMWLGLERADHEYLRGISISSDLRKSVDNLQHMNQDIDYKQINQNLSDIEILLRGIVKDEYSRNRIEATSHVYNNVWILNPILGVITIFLFSFIK